MTKFPHILLWRNGGKSLAVRLPADVVRKAGLSEGATVDLCGGER